MQGTDLYQSRLPVLLFRKGAAQATIDTKGAEIINHTTLNKQKHTSAQKKYLLDMLVGWKSGNATSQVTI